MTDRNSPVSGVAERYASALFDLARDERALDAVAADLKSFQALLDENADLRRLVASPLFSAEEQAGAIDAIARRSGMDALVGNFLRLVARNRRLFAVPGMIRAYGEMLAAHRGEVTAELVSARPLGHSQTEALRQALRDRLGKDVAIEARVDPAILGGLVVRVGSRMIDTSLRTRLNSLKNRLKEAS